MNDEIVVEEEVQEEVDDTSKETQLIEFPVEYLEMQEEIYNSLESINLLIGVVLGVGVVIAFIKGLRD